MLDKLEKSLYPFEAKMFRKLNQLSQMSYNISPNLGFKNKMNHFLTNNFFQGSICRSSSSCKSRFIQNKNNFFFYQHNLFNITFPISYFAFSKTKCVSYFFTDLTLSHPFIEVYFILFVCLLSKCNIK